PCERCPLVPFDEWAGAIVSRNGPARGSQAARPPPVMLHSKFLAGLSALWIVFGSAAVGFAQSPSAAEYESIQAAVDANPGKMIFVPAGDYTIDQRILIGANGGGLFGPGRIIQTNSEQPIVRVENARGVQIRDLTLTRAEGKMD